MKTRFICVTAAGVLLSLADICYSRTGSPLGTSLLLIPENSPTPDEPEFLYHGE